MRRPSNLRFAGLSFALAAAANADTFYVNGSCGNNAWTGTSSVCSAPNGPKLTIQAGIDASVNGDTVIVADGTYTGPGNKNLDFGGPLITLRSENGPAACIIDCENDGRGVRFHNRETADTVLEGFTIRKGLTSIGGAILCESASPTILNCVLTNNQSRRGGGLYSSGGNPTISNCTISGNASRKGGGLMLFDSSPAVTNCTIVGNWLFGTDDSGGGGMFNVRSSPTVTDCTFTDNSTTSRGGGMYNLSFSKPTVTDCTFSGNSAASGGGMYNSSRSNPHVTNCTFSGNSAAHGGGGLMNVLGGPTVANCTFSGNSAQWGGGMRNFESSPTVTNCTFSANVGSFSGGGMYNRDGSPTVTNCTFVNNTGPRGAGIFNLRGSPTVTNCTFSGNSAALGGGGIYNRDSSPAVNNCILWDDGPDEIVDDGGAIVTVSFSDVQGGWPGTGNIDADPLFVDAANGNYRLAAGSPCIDAADNTAVPAGILTDLDRNPRFVDDPATPDTGVPGGAGGDAIVDMGAYEFPCDPCDMNCDGLVDALDIEAFIDLLFHGGVPCNTCTGDTNGDGFVDAGDLEGFINCLFP